MAFYDDFPRPSRPRKVEGGIQTRSRRGAIGETWWSQRFIEVLTSFGMGSRLTRGRSYARSGQVLDVHVAAGSVAATVQGSRAKPYRVRIKLSTIKPRQWEHVEKALAGQAIYCAKLLAGEMPQDVESVFADVDLTLFPASGADLSMECSCPDWAVPCKHIAAAFYVLAEAFDTDPFLIFAWRGRTKEDLLERLRELRGATGSAAFESQGAPPDVAAVLALEEPPLADCLHSFWQHAADSPAPLAARSATEPVPDLVLRQLEPLPLEVRGHNVVDLLRPAYEAMATRHG
jgi:uncharacterized Zn finger protein